MTWHVSNARSSGPAHREYGGQSNVSLNWGKTYSDNTKQCNAGCIAPLGQITIADYVYVDANVKKCGGASAFVSDRLTVVMSAHSDNAIVLRVIRLVVVGDYRCYCLFIGLTSCAQLRGC